jgi:hypothetical protein
MDIDRTYRNAVGVLGSDALSFCLALLEWMLVLELGTHDEYGLGFGRVWSR